MVTKSTTLVPPSLSNSSCTHPRYQNVTLLSTVSVGDALQSLVILALTFGIIFANILLISVINSKRYTKYIHSQPRYLLTSLACNDLAMGLCVTPFAIVPTLRHCWPYAEIVCQVQALLRGAISQQSAVILICMAMDRYYCMLHPMDYHKQSNRKAWFIIIISITWVGSMSLFTVLVIKHGGFYFNATGMHACEPFYPKASLRILAACGFYFTFTMILMYCYGSAFDVNKLGFKKPPGIPACNSVASATVESQQQANSIEKLFDHERKLGLVCSRTMAAMSLGFIVLVTPWTIQEVVAACTGSRAPPSLDFVATWMTLSNSFWYPFIYWILNSQFRRICREIFNGIFRSSSHLNKHHHEHFCNNSPSTNFVGHTPDCDLERLSEKYWGEILERTVSTSSLQPNVVSTCNGDIELTIMNSDL
ncbi:trace amine-associated receptor 1 [Anthonomus grandis grandis]|uniref:trace amine-associated receptor 1 n=1 Tax=Anthonomus grandis grandis TaxID=2921223 RepID=UPI002164F076|nr:trace amine-associated receptor 1 [Anthonomus grandis grandis]